VHLSKQIGHFTCTIAVIGKKMGYCSENISPGHGSHIRWLSSTDDAYMADNPSKAPLFDTIWARFNHCYDIPELSMRRSDFLKLLARGQKTA